MSYIECAIDTVHALRYVMGMGVHEGALRTTESVKGTIQGVTKFADEESSMIGAIF